MLTYLQIRLKPCLKIIKVDILYYFLLNRIFINRTAVAVEKDLSSLAALDASLFEGGLKLVEITPDSITQDEKTRKALVYPVDSKSENRYLKAMYYLSRGYGGFALARGRDVCGEIWYVVGPNDQKAPIHQDLEWLRIPCGHNEAYAFDMHLYPHQRGKNMAVVLQSAALHEMKKKGVNKVFGYYWADYIPALWVHRTLRWKEQGRIKVSRFLFIRHYASQSNPKAKEPSAPDIA